MKNIYDVDDHTAEQCEGYREMYNGDTDYAIDQNGGVLSVFSEHGVEQYGDGFWGNLAAGAWRVIKPFLFSGAKAAANTALSSAGKFVSDISSGENVREAAR